VIRYSGVEKRITQIQMINWEDHTVPDMEYGYKSIEYLINSVNEMKNNPQGGGPVVVHCR
jgi:protein tyrosine phosphatase